MNIPDDQLLQLLLLANAVLLAAAAVALGRFCRRFERMTHFWQSPTGAAIADKASQHERQQLLVNLRLERQLSGLRDKIDVLANAEPNANLAPQQLPIDNAIRMAKNGASIEELTRTCGLNIGEARLMQKLHREVAQVEAH